MKNNNKLFVRIDKSVTGQRCDKQLLEAHFNYLQEITKNRYFVGGGFKDTLSGMIIFEAKDLPEAKSLCDNDPVIKSNLFSYELFEWEIVIGKF